MFNEKEMSNRREKVNEIIEILKYKHGIKLSKNNRAKINEFTDR
jgi:hypothetical protein